MLCAGLITLSAAGKWNGTVDVAVKTLKDENMSTEEFLGEAALMKVCHVRQVRFCAHGWQGLKHANLLTLYAVCTVGFPIFIITELMCNGALLDYLQSPEGENLRLPQLLDMGANIAAGMVCALCVELACLCCCCSCDFFWLCSHFTVVS